MNLKKNVGLIDQIVRALLVLDLIVPYLMGLISGSIVYFLGSMAVLLSVSCITGYCWFYDTMDLSTRHEANI